MMICAKAEIAKKRISFFQTQLRNVSITMSGKDLLKLGLPPGPLFGKVLQSITEAKLNGTVKTRDDEFRFVKRQFIE